jgi:hypothetical protein
LGDRITWAHGDATALAGRGVGADLAVMTGKVAQVSVSDDHRNAVVPGHSSGQVLRHMSAPAQPWIGGVPGGFSY